MSDPRGQNQTNGRALASADSRPNPSDSRLPGEADHLRAWITFPPSLLGYQSRSPLFRTLSASTSSSGYFSFEYDSLPNSPLMMHNKSTQTPSPSSQAIVHAQQRLIQVYENFQDNDMPQDPGHPIRPRPLSMPADVRPEVWVGQELRRIGDEINQLHTHRGGRNRNGQRIRSECTLCLWMTFLVGLLIQTILRRR